MTSSERTLRVTHSHGINQKSQEQLYRLLGLSELHHDRSYKIHVEELTPEKMHLRKQLIKGSSVSWNTLRVT